MKRQLSISAVVISVLLCAVVSSAEFGFSVGGSSNYKAGFHDKAQKQRYRNNPGLAVPGVPHYYDDGYNLPDGSGASTSLWGYDNASQDNGGSLTMNSSREVADQQGSSASDSGVHSSLEIYWQDILTDNEKWNFGVRVALRWQEIEIDGGGRYSTSIETTSDTYSYASTLPPAPYEGGGGTAADFRIGTVPERSFSQSRGRTFKASRDMEADLTAVDLGPLVAYDITEELRVILSAGGTLAWMDSDFSYRDDAYSSGSDSDDDWLLGFYVGADLQYLLTESWGVFAGVSHCHLEDFNQDANGRSAELEFDDSYSFRFGVFLR